MALRHGEAVSKS